MVREHLKTSRLRLKHTEENQLKRKEQIEREKELKRQAASDKRKALLGLSAFKEKEKAPKAITKKANSADLFDDNVKNKLKKMSLYREATDNLPNRGTSIAHSSQHDRVQEPKLQASITEPTSAALTIIKNNNLIDLYNVDEEPQFQIGHSDRQTGNRASQAEANNPLLTTVSAYRRISLFQRRDESARATAPSMPSLQRTIGIQVMDVKKLQLQEERNQKHNVRYTSCSYDSSLKLQIF